MPNEKRNLSRLAKAAARSPQPVRSHDEQFELALQRILHASDPVAFCRDRLKFDPDPWQEQLLRSDRKRTIVNIARQQGKSTTAAAKAVHCVYFRPKSLVLLVAPAMKQANELRRKIDDHLMNLRDPEFRPVTDNAKEIEFPNGARIVLVAADQDTVRSFSAVTMIIEDESAAVPDDVYEAMEPMLLVSDGQHILLSTPMGLQGHFARIWHDGGDTWERYEVTVWSNPRVPQARIQAIRDEKERLGRLWKFQQEYECSFIAAAQGLVYPYDPKKNAATAMSLDAKYGWQFVLGVDYGFNDSTAYVVLGWQRDDPHVYVVESFKKRGLLAPEAAEIALALTKKYPFARMVGDSGGLGKGYIEEARRRYRLPMESAEKNNKRGYIELMASDIRAGLLKVMPNNKDLLDEWGKLPWDEEREMPMDGYEDHISDAALYAWRATYAYLEEVRRAPPKPGTREALLEEAERMLEDRIAKVTKPKTEWWDAEPDDGGAGWTDWMN